MQHNSQAKNERENNAEPVNYSIGELIAWEKYRDTLISIGYSGSIINIIDQKIKNMRVHMEPLPSAIECNESTEGEAIEIKIKKAIENDEPIEESAELIFTERREGVIHEYNPKGDKFEMAIDAMGSNAKSKLAQRTAKLEEMHKKQNPDQNQNEPAK